VCVCSAKRVKPMSMRHGNAQNVASGVLAHVSLRFEMDLQANCSPVSLSSASLVVPNCPRPKTRPRVYNAVTSCGSNVLHVQRLSEAMHNDVTDSSAHLCLLSKNTVCNSLLFEASVA